MNNEPILLLVAPHSEGCGFAQIEKYHGIIEESVFDCIGKPTFVNNVVDIILARPGNNPRERPLAAGCPEEEIHLAERSAWLGALDARWNDDSSKTGLLT